MSASSEHSTQLLRVSLPICGELINTQGVFERLDCQLCCESRLPIEQ